MIDLAYVAGFYDGEGSIGIYRTVRTRKTFYLRSQLVQNVSPEARRLLDHLQVEYGGHVSFSRSANGREKMNWQIGGPKAAFFLVEIQPFLRLKARQADLAIRFQMTRPEQIRGVGGRLESYPRSVTRADEMMANVLKAMKKTG